MCVLALDLGNKTGWAKGSGRLLSSGVCTLQTDAQKRKEPRGKRGIRFAALLEELAADASEIVIELPRNHKGIDAAHAFGGWRYEVEKFCATYGLKLHYKEVSHIKQQATGKGNANKEAMIEAARKRGWNPRDDNEADALWILDLHLNPREEVKK